MQEKIQQIYELLYSPIVTPHNLVENAKLNNYEYVKYYKTEDAFVAEMKCTDLSGDKSIFYYHFNVDNFLERIFQKQENEVVLIFDRKQEEKEKRDAFLKSTKIVNKRVG